MRIKDLLKKRKFLNQPGYPDGEQNIYKFKNGYGASVVRNSISYGHEEGLWELGVITFDKNNDFKLCYDTEITNDVIGYLTENQVDEILEKIEKL